MSTSDICCTHQQVRIDSPEPPPRPLATIDGIFAAAILPEDHPHALKFPERKPETDSAIVQSPSIASKIKLQFTRKSVRNLKKVKEYDDDARPITLKEMLDNINDTTNSHGRVGQFDHDHRFSSVVELGQTSLAVPGTTSPDVRTSVLKSLGYLQPLLQRSSELRLSREPLGLGELATLVAARPALTDVSNGNDVSALPKSLSSPTLPLSETRSCYLPRRSRSEYDLYDHILPTKDYMDNPLIVLPSRDEWFENVTASINSTQRISNAASLATHVEEQTKTYEARDLPPVSVPESGQTTIDNMLHLHEMDISQQLRSMSQLSETVEDETHLQPLQPWGFHYRERSDLGCSSTSGRHSRQKSSSGMDSSAVPFSWGRVWSPIRDTASSMYSRPVSAEANADESSVRKQDTSHYEPLNDLNTLFADWPLKPSASIEDPSTTLEVLSGRRSGTEELDKPLPSTPADRNNDSASVSPGTATNNERNSSVRFLSPPYRAPSIPSKSSLSTLTKTSKQSKFLEGFSPPRKTVRKRLSVFKFLRPGSRKEQGRSISSPILNTKSLGYAAPYDGQSEDPALLTVQYELTEQPGHITRSMSMNQLGPPLQDPGGHLAPQNTLQRRPTLADYERNLSVTGDDRRRPSAVNVQRVKEIQEDDRRESVGLRRRLSRARALRDDASPLMAQALEKHQQEKALFRSASKQRDSVKEIHHSPVFDPSPFGRTGSSLPPPSLTDHNDLLNTPETGQPMSVPKHGPDADHLLSPPILVPGASQRTSPATSTRAPSTKTSIAGPRPQTPPQGRKRIGTSLESWSRYPSHTHTERCGSAGLKDAILTRDFATDINPEDIQISRETEAPSPDKKSGKKGIVQRSKSSTPSSRSVTFSGIMRYYSNLFHTRGWHGQNRRTSVTIGGRLEYPELEMLPPQIPTEVTGSHKHSEYLKRFEEHIKEDAEKLKHYFKEEEHKFEGYMKKEEDRFEDFVKVEEHKLEDFVKREEGKLKDFVVEEEDKFIRPHHQSGSSSESSHTKSGRFRAGSIFEAPSSPGGDELKRNETGIGPNDGIDESTATQEVADSGLVLDGSGEVPSDGNNCIPSKAETWSRLYQECLIRPVSRGVKEQNNTSTVSATSEKQAWIMPPPALRPVKPRTPEKPHILDPKATIRRFPSATVIDDRKGHYRSISLVSVKTSKSGTFERSSTHDLVELIQAREEAEREKLLNAVGAGDHMKVDGPAWSSQV